MTQRPVQKKSDIKRSKRKNTRQPGMDNRLKALIMLVAALVVLILVVVTVFGGFGGKVEKETKAVEETTAEETETEKETETTASSKGTVYLTFDYTPSSITENILSVLDNYNVKATFFVKENDNNSSVLKTISEKGHTLGVLTSSDDEASVYADLESFKNDVNTCEQYIFKESGELTNIYRFPGSSQSANNAIGFDECKTYLDEVGMTYYDWNVSGYDDSEPALSSDEIYQNVIDQIHNLSTDTYIVLLHDTDANAATVEALPKIIETLQSEGYGFDKITEKTKNVEMNSDSTTSDSTDSADVNTYDDSYSDGTAYDGSADTGYDDTYYEETAYDDASYDDTSYDENAVYEDTSEQVYDENTAY